MRDFEEQGEAWMMMTGGFWSVALNSLQLSSPISWNLWPFFWRMKPFSERFVFFSQSFLNQQLLNCEQVQLQLLLPGDSGNDSASLDSVQKSIQLSDTSEPQLLGANSFDETSKETKQISICEDVSDIFRMLFWVHGHSTFGMHLIKSLNLLSPKNINNKILVQRPIVFPSSRTWRPNMLLWLPNRWWNPVSVPTNKTL